MKRITFLILALVMIFSLCACGGNPPAASPAETKAPAVAQSPAAAETQMPEQGPEATPVELGGSIDSGSFFMTFDTMELLPEYSYKTSEYSSTSLYVEAGYQILLVRGHIENKSTAAFTDSSFSKTVVVNGTYTVDEYDVRLTFLRDKYFEIDPYTDLDYFLYINVPDKLADTFETATFTLGFNDDMSIPVTVWNSDGTKTTETDNLYSLTGTLSQSADGEGAKTETTAGPKRLKSIAIGETIVTDSYEFTLTNVELTYEILPPNTSSVYTSYPAESGKVYVHVAADVKNTMQRDIRIDELFTSAVTYDGKYPYTGFTIVNDGDNRFDWVSSYVAATPLETCKAHGVIECPVEVDTSGKSIAVTLTLGDEDYEYILR